jgi:hypothetical protein
MRLARLEWLHGGIPSTAFGGHRQGVRISSSGDDPWTQVRFSFPRSPFSGIFWVQPQIPLDEKYAATVAQKGTLVYYFHCSVSRGVTPHIVHDALKFVQKYPKVVTLYLKWQQIYRELRMSFPSRVGCGKSKLPSASPGPDVTPLA